MRANSHNSLAYSVQRPKLGLAVPVLAMVAVLGGCNRQSAGGQTVAVVNGDPITLSELKLELNNLPAAAREQSKAAVLQAMIDRRLLAKDAENQKRDKVPAFVLQERRMREVMLAQQTINAFAQSSRQPISQTEVNTYLDRHPNMGTERRIMIVNQAQFATPAKDVLEALKPTKTMDALLGVLQARNIPFQRGRTQIDTALLPDVEMQKLSTLSPGEPLVVINGPSTVVSEIAEQKSVPLSEGDQQKLARNRIESERAQTAIKQQSDSLRGSAKITYGDAYKPKPGAPAQ